LHMHPMHSEMPMRDAVWAMNELGNISPEGCSKDE
jgi:hypothetical protein